MARRTRRRSLAPPAFIAFLVGFGACTDDPVGFGLDCSIDATAIFDGGPGKDGIPALTNPGLVGPDHPEAAYVRPGDRVIGLDLGDQALAVPLGIGWWHEIVNLEVGGRRIAITYCPLTGSGLAFDRAAAGGAEFGVSGLLYMNNLLMYDRNRTESLWPQMARRAACGPADGARLEMLPVIETTWAGWTSLHPHTVVVSSATGHGRNYRAYPYGSYDETSNRNVLFPIPYLDGRRPPKERVLGIPAGASGGIAFPYGLLADDDGLAPPHRAVHARVDGDDVVVFWDRDRQAAMAYRPRLDGQGLRFDVVDGALTDLETGSRWRVDGRATDGIHAGRRLEPVAEAFIAFWFAWAIFYPDAALWHGNGEA